MGSSHIYVITNKSSHAGCQFIKHLQSFFGVYVYHLNTLRYFVYSSNLQVRIEV